VTTSVTSDTSDVSTVSGFTDVATPMFELHAI
jgi:hypothetical protein